MAADERAHDVGRHVACLDDGDQAHDRHEAAERRERSRGTGGEQPQPHHERERQADRDDRSDVSGDSLQTAVTRGIAGHLDREHDHDHQPAGSCSPAERGERSGISRGNPCCEGWCCGDRGRPERHHAAVEPQPAGGGEPHGLQPASAGRCDHHRKQPRHRRHAPDADDIRPGQGREAGERNRGHDQSGGEPATLRRRCCGVAHDGDSPPKRRSRPANAAIASSR